MKVDDETLSGDDDVGVGENVRERGRGMWEVLDGRAGLRLLNRNSGCAPGVSALSRAGLLGAHLQAAGGATGGATTYGDVKRSARDASGYGAANDDRIRARGGRRRRPRPRLQPRLHPWEPGAHSTNYFDDTNWSVLERDGDGYRVRPSVTFHMYTSSTPCGNAAIKRWAKGAKEKFTDGLGPFQTPPGSEEHGSPSWSAVKEGQIAFLYKRDPGSCVSPDGDTRGATDTHRGD